MARKAKKPMPTLDDFLSEQLRYCIVDHNEDKDMSHLHGCLRALLMVASFTGMPEDNVNLMMAKALMVHLDETAE